MGLVILFASGVLAAVGTFLAVARGLGVLAGYGADRSLFLGTALWNIAVPLALAVVISAVLELAPVRRLAVAP